MSLPETAETPAAMEPLFREPAPRGARSFSVTVTVPGWAGMRRTVMDLVVAEGDAPGVLAVAFAALAELPDGEMTVRRA